MSKSLGWQRISNVGSDWLGFNASALLGTVLSRVSNVSSRTT
ncbi:MAG: hypothetical protein U5K81_14955 [Trueperaceae bacterium]|nr:hypothetical protein [Trueperaceae bacterium]